MSGAYPEPAGMAIGGVLYPNQQPQSAYPPQPGTYPPQPGAYGPAAYAAYQGQPAYPGNPYAYMPYFMTPPKSGVERVFDALTGTEGKAIVRFRDLFRDTFKKHSKEDMISLLYAGTPAAMYDRKWRLPWLYARVLAVVLGAAVVMVVALNVWENPNLIPGVLFLGALALPIAVVIFFWEFDQSRNISFFDVVRMFMIGAVLSLVMTMLLDTGLTKIGLEGAPGEVVGSIVIGFTEETAKGVVVFLLLRSLHGRLISNGLAVGAIVGAGFAVFETMGYGLYYGLMQPLGDTGHITISGITDVLVLRGWMSPFGHVAWTAIIGAAIMLAQRPGVISITPATMNWAKFLPLYLIPIALHALWDYVNVPTIWGIAVFTLAVGAAAWFLLIRLTNTGLRQYATLTGTAV